MTEAVAGKESSDFYGQATSVEGRGGESPSRRLSSRRSSHDDVGGGSSSGRHHYRSATALSTLPERKSSMATETTSVGATRNRPASLSPFRPGSRSKRDVGSDRCQQRSTVGSTHSPEADHYCYQSNPAAGSTIWQPPSSTTNLSSVSYGGTGPNIPPSATTSSTTPSSSSSSSSSYSSGLFNWRKKYPRRSSSSSVVPTSSTASSLFSSCVGAQQSETASDAIHASRSVAQQRLQPSSSQHRPNPAPAPTRRNSQPAAFSLPQLVRRSLQPLISSSPSTDADDQSDSVSKLRYMKCKQVYQKDG